MNESQHAAHLLLELLETPCLLMIVGGSCITNIFVIFVDDLTTLGEIPRNQPLNDCHQSFNCLQALLDLDRYEDAEEASDAGIAVQAPQHLQAKRLELIPGETKKRKDG